MSSLTNTKGQSKTRVEPAAHDVCAFSTVWRWTTRLVSLISVWPNVKYGHKLRCEVTVISCWILNVITYHLIRADIYGKCCLNKHQSDLWPPNWNQFLYVDVLTSKKSPEVVLRTCSHNGTDGRQPENTMPLGTTIAVRRQNNVWAGAHIISEDNLWVQNQ